MSEEEIREVVFIFDPTSEFFILNFYDIIVQIAPVFVCEKKVRTIAVNETEVRFKFETVAEAVEYLEKLPKKYEAFLKKR